MKVTIELTENETLKIIDLVEVYQRMLSQLMLQNPEVIELEKTRLEILNKILIETA